MRESQYEVDFLDCCNKGFICLDEEGNSRKIQGIPRPISIREISTFS
jgi:hypothetical protein